MALRRPIYLDYMATTPIDPRVMDKMMAYMGPEGHFGNPASVTHGYGQMAAVAVDEARMQVATLVGASPDEIVFTSGATEANNLAILGAAQFYQRKGRHLITLSTEHKSVLDSFHHLEHLGFDVTYLDPNSNGLLDTKTLLDALRPETILVSVMQVNNEIGVIQDISALGQCLKNKGIVFHVDAAQSAGKLPIDLHALSVDLMSFSAHKIYGPKGIGALYVRQKPRIRLLPQSFGGGHEGGLRSGTLPTHQIVGMGEACAMAGELRAEEQTRILNLRHQLWAGIQHLPGVALNGDALARVSGNLNIRFDGLENKALLMALHELALSTTSACVSSKATPSYVLRAIGLSATAAQSSIRLSLGRFTTEEDVLRTIAIFCHEIPRLHAGSIQ